MAKLHFFYSVMNAGKSTHLLQAAHNYESKGWNVLYFTSGLDNRHGVGYISSRAIEKKKEAIAISDKDNVTDYVRGFRNFVIFVDEVQFLNPKHIEELAKITEDYNAPVLCYGLKNNSNGELFGPAIIKLLALADQIKEIKTVCHCGSKATQILRRRNGTPIKTSGDAVVEPGDSDYESVCRRHYNQAFN